MRSTRIGDTKHLTNTTQHARLITGEGELGLSWVFLSKAFDLFERVCYNGLVNKIMSKIVGNNLIINWHKAVVIFGFSYDFPFRRLQLCAC